MLPSAAGVRSLAIIRAEADVPEVFAFDVEDPEALAIRLDSAEEGPLYVALFAASLAELGLPAGRLSIAEPGVLSFPLPEPLRAAEGIRRDGRLEWEENDAALTMARATWLEGEPIRTKACPEITVVTQNLPLGPESKRWISVAEPLGQGRVLLATEHGEWMISTRDGIEVVSSLSSSVAHGASFLDRHGNIVLAQCEPEGLFWLDRNLAYDRRVTVSCGDWTSDGAFTVRMDGSPPDQPYEIVTMTRGGRVVLYDEEDRPSELYYIGAQVILQFVSWDEPGRVVLTTVEPEIIMLERGQTGRRVRPDWKARGEPPKFYRARRLPGGLALAGEDGEGRGVVMLRERAGDTWRVVANTGQVGALYQLLPTADGFAYAGASRQVGWWTRETGFCPAPYFGPPGPDGRPQWDLGSYSFYVLVPVSEDEMFVAGFVSLSETSARVWWVRRQR